MGNGVGGQPQNGEGGPAPAAPLGGAVPAAPHGGALQPQNGEGGPAPAAPLGGAVPAAPHGGALQPQNEEGGFAPAAPLGGAVPAAPLGGAVPAESLGGAVQPQNEEGGFAPAAPLGGAVPAAPLGGAVPAESLGGAVQPQNGEGGPALAGEAIAEAQQLDTIRYDPIALRQPADLHSWNWCCDFLPDWLKRGILIHESVWQVDGRDQHWGLAIWLLVLTLYIVYVGYGCYGLVKQRQTPPTNVQLVPTTGHYLEKLGPLYLELRIQPWTPKFAEWAQSVKISDVICRQDFGGADVQRAVHTSGAFVQAYVDIAELDRMVPFNAGPDMCTIIVSWIIATNDSSESENLVGLASVSRNVPCLQELDGCPQDAGGMTYSKDISKSITFTVERLVEECIKEGYEFDLQVTEHRKLPKSILLGKLPPETEWEHRLFEQGQADFHISQDCPRMNLGYTAHYGAQVLLTLPDQMTVYRDQETVTLSAVGGLGGIWTYVLLAITLLLPLQPSGRRRVRSCLRPCFPPVGFFRGRYETWRGMLHKDHDAVMEDDDVEEQKQRENATGYKIDIDDIAKLELPSMEERVARIERNMRMLFGGFDELKVERSERFKVLQERRHQRQQEEEITSGPERQATQEQRGEEEKHEFKEE